jgi:hypothetical protein
MQSDKFIIAKALRYVSQLSITMSQKEFKSSFNQVANIIIFLKQNCLNITHSQSKGKSNCLKLTEPEKY